jgi:proteasome activator subunit 4
MFRILKNQNVAIRCDFEAEILASLVRGSKHWPFDMVSSMWSWVVPLIRTALEKVPIL